MERFPEDSPFLGLSIASHASLHDASRYTCQGCKKSSKYYCYRCCQIAPDLRGVTSVALPLPLVIIKDSREADSKSTAVHAKILADPVTLIDFDSYTQHLTYWSPPWDREVKTAGNFDDSPEIDLQDSVLLYPGPDSVSIADIDWSTVRSLVVIDGTWRQARAMSTQCKQLSTLRKVHLGTDNQTFFWRYQNLGSHCLSTIEAIYHFYRNFKGASQSLEQSEKNFDNLLFFFSFFAHLIRDSYQCQPDRPFTSRHSNANFFKGKNDTKI